jgi:uncharacterized protein
VIDHGTGDGVLDRRPQHRLIAGEIPALTWRGHGADPHPAIISVHGAGGSKQDILPETVDAVVSRGVTLVTIDAYLHGKRAPAGFDIRAVETFTPALFLEIIAHTARDLFTVVAYLQDNSAIDASRIGLRGGSMGGYIALAAMGMGIAAHAVLSVAGGADYLHSFRSRLKLSACPVTGQLQGQETLVHQADPLYNVARFPPRPVLLIHGVRDSLSPISGDLALYHALVPYYQEHPEDCLFLVHAGEHATPEALEHLSWIWLIEQVASASSAPV